jgi:hypothetical protein
MINSPQRRKTVFLSSFLVLENEKDSFKESFWKQIEELK